MQHILELFSIRQQVRQNTCRSEEMEDDVSEFSNSARATNRDILANVQLSEIV